MLRGYRRRQEREDERAAWIIAGIRNDGTTVDQLLGRSAKPSRSLEARAKALAREKARKSQEDPMTRKILGLE